MKQEEFLDKLKTNQDSDYAILFKKNSDYATTKDPFSNFVLVKELGICSVEQGILVRMCDKMSRISNLIHREALVKDERIQDTLSDLRNYANILQVYIDNKKSD